MDAELLLDDRIEVADGVRVEMVAWWVPTPVQGSSHSYKYRLALIADGVCVMRYDNEAGKGDHRHVGKRQFPYSFVDLEDLRIDFWSSVEEWMQRHGGS